MTNEHIQEQLDVIVASIEHAPIPEDDKQQILAALTSSNMDVNQHRLHASLNEAFGDLGRTITSAKVVKFADPEFKAAIHGIQSLIDRLMKAAKSLNQQDEARKKLEEEVSLIDELKNNLVYTFKGLSSVEV